MQQLPLHFYLAFSKQWTQTTVVGKTCKELFCFHFTKNKHIPHTFFELSETLTLADSTLTSAEMLWLLQCLVLLVAILRVSCVSDDVIQCPTWRRFNHFSRRCECGNSIKYTIKCSEGNDTVKARFDVCVSWDSQSESVLASLCKYKRSRTSVEDRVFSELPQNPKNLSYDECDLNNRQGMFCGKCKEGFAPSLHIFSPACVNCSHCLQNPTSLFLFMGSEILPLTIFYLIIMGLHVNLMSGPITGYILFCQTYVNFIHIHTNIWRFITSQAWKYVVYWNVYVLFPLSGIWNLNFFSVFVPNICYGCNFNNLSGILMQYISVAYIFTLVFLAYVISKLNIVSKLSSLRYLKPILHCSIRWRRKWSASDSAIHSLATFTALLIVKVAVISIQVHSTSPVYNVSGSKLHHVLSFEPSFKPSSPKYTMYAIATFVPVFMFILIPAVVLCLHPSRHFQYLLRHCCGSRKRLALAIFVDTICSGFRDGLDGGRDWRRLYPLSLFIIVGIHFFYIHNSSYLPDAGIILLSISNFPLSPFIAYFKPFKTKEMNLSLSFHLIIIALAGLILGLWVQDYYLNARTLEVILTVLLTLPHVAMLLWLLSIVWKRFKLLITCPQRMQHLFQVLPQNYGSC